jgi:hypothetical protein
MKHTGLQKMAARTYDKGFRLKNRLTYPYTNKKGDSKLVLLRRNGTTKKFDNLGETSGYGIGFDSFRNLPTFEVATLDKVFGLNKDQYFNDAVKLATHIALVPQMDMFSIRDADEEMIIYLDFTTKVFGKKQGDRYEAE